MKVSIITIVKNNKDFLSDTVESVLSQKYKNFEYIIIDGVSTDGSIDIIKHYAALDKRIKWISEKDQGISDAMNKGIALSTGDIIAHLHADDYYADEDVLSGVSSAFKRCDSSCWLTGGLHIVNKSKEILTTIGVRNYSYDALVDSNTIMHPSTFVLRRAFELAGMFDRSLSYAMDYDLWLRLGRIGDPLRIDAPLACFRAHEGSLSTSHSGAALHEAWLVRKKYLCSKPIKLLRGYYRYLKLRREYILFNDSLLGR